MSATRRNTRGACSEPERSRSVRTAFVRLPRHVQVLLLAAVLAGCSGAGVGPGSGPGTSTGSGQPSTQSSVGLSIDPFPDGIIDVTLHVVDATSLATLYSQAWLSQATPFSAEFSFGTTPVLVTATVQLHQSASACIYTGTNSTAGTTLTDGSIDFGRFMLPLFVVNDLVNPTTVVDVQSIPTASTMTLASAFASGPYHLYRTRPVAARLTYTGVGTSVLPFAMWNNTLGTFQISTRF